ncbi:MAG: S9 family peptidase [Acidobacteria bacterium]|nr:S9 family peptidase [Acidobacteriota bacterium]
MPILLVLAALLAARPSTAAKTPLRASDIFELKTATDPQISPDGRKIVYVRGFSDIMSDKRFSNLWIISFDGSDHRPLTTGNYNDTSPRWSPDGSRLIYLSDREGSVQIHMRWMDSGQTAKLTNLREAPGSLAWSPDGKQIAFFALVPDPPRKIGKLPDKPAGATWAEPAKIIDRMVYRFDRAGYLTPGYSQLFVLPADGRTPRQVSSGNFQHHGGPLGGGRIAWTPDSRSILLSANRSPDAEHEGWESDIHEFDVAGGAVKKLTSRKGPDESPSVSPDGRHVAYVGFDDRHQGYQVRKLYVMNRDGSGARPLSAKLDRDVETPQWAPDSSGVYFVYSDQGNTKLGYYPVDGPMKSLAGNLGSTTSAYGGGGAFTIAPNGHIAATYTRPDVPGEIAVATAANPALKPITAVNEDVLGQRKLGAVEEIWYTSSKDGRRIQGWILKPPDFDPARKYPLILEIHGGPFANYGDRFDLEKQIYAAGGYLVLYTNPRGSTSYGEDFGNLIHHAYPGDDFQDLNSGVDAAIAKGNVDPNNLFVTGGSGGGVLTCWVVGHTTRFRAAVSLYPVINWYSFIGTADIGARVANYWFPGAPWDHAAHYEKRSLLSVVKEVKTPTMVMTGEEDYRTPISEAEQYYRALKMLKVESVMVRVPGEPHGITRRPSHHAAKVSYVVGWFDEHREKPGARSQASE